MKKPLLFSNEQSRRRFVSLAAKSFLGLSILPWASPLSSQAAGLGLNRPLNQAPKAKNVIYLYLEHNICLVLLKNKIY